MKLLLKRSFIFLFISFSYSYCAESQKNLLFETRPILFKCALVAAAGSCFYKAFDCGQSKRFLELNNWENVKAAINPFLSHTYLGNYLDFTERIDRLAAPSGGTDDQKFYTYRQNKQYAKSIAKEQFNVVSSTMTNDFLKNHWSWSLNNHKPTITKEIFASTCTDRPRQRNEWAEEFTKFQASKIQQLDVQINNLERSQKIHLFVGTVILAVVASSILGKAKK